MNVREIESIPAGANPFNHDLYHMGTRLGSNIMIMHANHTGDECKYLILVNTKTGQRWRLGFDEAAMQPVGAEAVMAHLQYNYRIGEV